MQAQNLARVYDERAARIISEQDLDSAESLLIAVDWANADLIDFELGLQLLLLLVDDAFAIGEEYCDEEAADAIVCAYYNLALRHLRVKSSGEYVPDVDWENISHRASRVVDNPSARLQRLQRADRIPMRPLDR